MEHEKIKREREREIKIKSEKVRLRESKRNNGRELSGLR